MMLTDGFLWSFTVLSLLLFAILLYLEKTKHKRTKEKYQQMEEQYYFITQNARDIIYRLRIYPERRFEYVSPATETILGYKPDDFYQDALLVYSLVYVDDRGKLEDLLSGRIDFTQRHVLRWHHRDGRMVWVEENTEPIYDDSGNLIAIQGIARDVSSQKKLEQTLTRLSQYDKLTGVYNRTYFEQEIARLHGMAQPCGLIIIDVDGLKKVNDTKGHPMGDRLIQATANVISKSCRKKEIIARIGGDEFAIVIPNATEQVLEGIRQRIQRELTAYNSQNDLYLSLSIGYSVGEKNMEALYKKADEDMYRQKNMRLTNHELEATVK